jgi:prevent-host-death family protein
MTRTSSASPGRSRSPSSWPLQDAKAQFSELVRRARSEGPQHVTVRGREEVVVVSADEYRRLKGEPTGQALIDALRNSPHPEIDLTPKRMPMPVRDVEL